MTTTHPTVNCMFTTEAIESQFLPLNEVLKRYSVTRNTLLTYVREGRFVKAWRIRGALYWSRADLDAHDARLAAAVASAEALS